MPKLSLIIPAYNNAKTLPTTLNSLLEQSFQDFEIILVDDGSSDNTREILSVYGSRVRYFYQDNAGPTPTQNHGLREAQGQYISFCDADDYYLDREFFANALEMLESNAEIDAVYSGWLVVDESGKALAESKPWEKIPDFALEDWLKWSPSRYHALIIRHKVLLDFGGLAEKYPMSDDAYFFISMALAGIRLAWYRQLAVAYVRHPASVTSTRPVFQAENNLAMWREVLSHPSIPSTINKRQIYYQKLIWTIWVLYKAGLDIHPLLYETRAYSDHAPHALPFDQIVKIQKQSWYEVYGYRDLADIIPILAESLPSQYPFGISSAALLGWWLELWWWFYLNYEYQADDIALRANQWQTALKSYPQPFAYAALSLALMPSAGYGTGQAMPELIAEFATAAQLTRIERQSLEAIWHLRLLRREKLGIFSAKLSLKAWWKAVTLYLQLFRQSRQSAHRKREL